jgi:uncharacterized protein YgbK (DUF1537 family)
MGQLAIIADDLSSCTDCGIQIARDGLQTLVVLDQTRELSFDDKFDVMAMDTDSRAVSTEEAYQRVKIIASLVQHHFVSIYKSIDSTLRGNLGVEIDALMDVIDFDLATIAPAFPFYGRTTIGGIHYLHGKRISETEFASDPQSPVREADLIKLISSQSRRKVGHIELALLRQGNTAVAKRLGELLSDNVELVIFDVRLETDLRRIILSVASSNYRSLWVGSTGLAGHISRILKVRPEKPFRWQIPENILKPTLVVAGSASEVTREQLSKYKQQPGVAAVQLNPHKIILGRISREEEIVRCHTQLLNSLRKGIDIVLDVTSRRGDIATTQALGQKMGQNSIQVSTNIVEALAEITTLIIEKFPVYGLILTGGDTAKAICHHLGAKGIHILKEIEPGIPLARLIGNHELFIIIKAGGFGNADTIIHANRLLKGGQGK